MIIKQEQNMYLHLVTLTLMFWLSNKIVLQLDALQPQLSL